MTTEKRSLNDIPISYLMYDPLDPADLSQPPGFIGSITQNIGETAQLYKRGRGGWWAITAEWQGENWEKVELFIDGLMREIRAGNGSEEFFRGFLGKLQLTLPTGEVYIRDWTKIYNKWKAIYSRIGDNQLTNGSAESGAWADYGSPTTNEQSTAWVTDGSYSDHIVTSAASDGATIQSGIPIVEGKGYQARVSINLVSGNWFFEIYREDTGAALATRGENGTGEFVLTVAISDDNAYTGNVGLRLYADAASAEIYGDAAVFQDAPSRAETQWYEDTDSQAAFGVRESAILLAGMADAAARTRAQTDLRKWAWAHTFPPDRYEATNEAEQFKLEITILGYVFTLNSQYSATTGTDAISDHLATLISQAQFIEAGVIEANATEFQIDDRYPQRIWDAIEDMVDAGDGSGTRYACGVRGRELYYEALDGSHTYTQRGGRLYELDGAEAEPWRVEPAYVLLEDMPLGPGQISGYETDNPRVVYMFETVFDAKNWLAGGSGLKWRGERE